MHTNLHDLDLGWANQSVYVIGGGSSLSDFDWPCLVGKNVLGCNAAFYCGPTFVPNMLFGDPSFLPQHTHGLSSYAKGGGSVFSCARHLENPPTWVQELPRENKGLSNRAVSWNGSTGAAATSLALLQGAACVYLLGFDMQTSESGKSHFHNVYNTAPNASAYERFKQGMADVANLMPDVFPKSSVVNLEDGTSALQCFEKESCKAHFAKRSSLCSHVDSAL